MKIDIIIYSKHTAVGVVLLKALEICAVAYIQKFEMSIDKEILQQLNHKCRWMIEDSNVVEHLKNNYESGDPIEIDDFKKYVMRLYKICCFGIPVNDVIEHDDNYAELAKYSDTGFVFVLYDQLFQKGDSLKERIGEKALAKQIFSIAEILYERKTIEGFCYMTEFHYLGYGTKKSKQKALEYINKAKEQIGIDLSDMLPVIDDAIKNVSEE